MGPQLLHNRYRSFFQEHRTKPMAGFIDGDLVEKFIDLPRHQMDEIMRNMKVFNYYYCCMWPIVLKWGLLF